LNGPAEDAFPISEKRLIVAMLFEGKRYFGRMKLIGVLAGQDLFGTETDAVKSLVPKT